RIALLRYVAHSVDSLTVLFTLFLASSHVFLYTTLFRSVGDTESIAQSLRSNGAYKPIVVNKGTHTGRPNEVLAGNHTLKAHQLLVEQGETQFENIATWVVDVTNEQANRIVLADNRTADLGSYDNQNLLLLLQEIGDDLDGTGYEPEDKDMLKDLLDEPAT